MHDYLRNALAKINGFLKKNFDFSLCGKQCDFPQIALFSDFRALCTYPCSPYLGEFPEIEVGRRLPKNGNKRNQVGDYFGGSEIAKDRLFFAHKLKFFQKVWAIF